MFVLRILAAMHLGHSLGICVSKLCWEMTVDQTYSFEDNTSEAMHDEDNWPWGIICIL